MPKRGEGTDFIESLARGLDVIECFGQSHQQLSLTAVATATGLARPTARRILLTLAELGYVEMTDGRFALTPRVLTLGMAYVGSLNLWQVARPHIVRLVERTGESSSMAQLVGSDIVYVARVAVPKIIALSVDVGTIFPAVITSQGKILLAALSIDEVEARLKTPSRSQVRLRRHADVPRLLEELATVRARGWALADEELAPGVRSVAVPVRDGSGRVPAALKVPGNAGETSTELRGSADLPHLIQTASDVSADWAMWQSRPQSEVRTQLEAAASS